jgi:hypothetical protein
MLTSFKPKDLALDKSKSCGNPFPLSRILRRNPEFASCRSFSSNKGWSIRKGWSIGLSLVLNKVHCIKKALLSGARLLVEEDKSISYSSASQM